MTLNHWTQHFEENSEQLRALAGDKRWRIWRVYLAGCAHGFAQHWISVYQILAVKAGASVLPLTREYLKQV
ncbi:MAG: class I SAM-dependent methyltransferase [Desulfopila sp.]